ncbi:hypothetical protein ACKLNO_06990 [Neisseriaceae bacterium B1]
MKQIQDYLQTQALKLSCQDIAVARASTQAVIENGQAHIESTVWQHDRLPEYIQKQESQIKSLFMALDSLYSRHPIQSAALYAWLPENNDSNATSGDLIRLVQLGEPLENHVAVNSDSVQHYLAARTAHSGWANIAENVAHWLAIHELLGEHNRRAECQASLPIAGEDGIVYGVLHLENPTMLPENELANWVGFSLGVLPLMRALLPRTINDDNE